MHIHYLVMMGKKDEVQQILDKNPELSNVADEDSGNTLLMVAISSWQLDIADFLLSRENIDIYTKNHNGYNILHFLLLAMVSVKSEERECYYNMAKRILQRETRDRISNPTIVPLLKTPNKSGLTPLILVSSPREAEISHRILDIAKDAEVTVLAEQEAKRLKLYSGMSPRFLREGNAKGSPSRWRFSLFWFWSKKKVEEPMSLEPERERLIGRKMKVE